MAVASPDSTAAKPSEPSGVEVARVLVKLTASCVVVEPSPVSWAVEWEVVLLVDVLKL
jgi:hypothetical protein